MFPKAKLILYNDDLNYLLWLPHKTGSNTVRFILNHFDFHTKVIYENRPPVIYNYLNGSNNTDLIENHLDYKLISTIRNPYSRFISFVFYYNQIGSLEKFSMTDFEATISKIKNILANEPDSFRERKPDHFIRTESIYEDICKLDFIKESRLYNCGILDDICKKKFNSSIKSSDWKSYYNEELANKVFDLFKHTFELGIYDKDSWK